MDIGKRIKLIRGELSYGEFATKLSREGYTVYKGNLKKYEDGGVLPSTQFYISAFLNFHINLNWLITGSGYMYSTGEVSSEVRRLEAEVEELNMIRKKNKKSIKSNINLN